jgi:hypothetical protein
MTAGRWNRPHAASGPTPDAGVCELLGDARTDPHGPGDPGRTRACNTHPARRTKLLVVVLRIASIVAACGNNQASPAATSETTATPSLGATPPSEVTRAVRLRAATAVCRHPPGRQHWQAPAQALDGITVESLT